MSDRDRERRTQEALDLLRGETVIGAALQINAKGSEEGRLLIQEVLAQGMINMRYGMKALEIDDAYNNLRCREVVNHGTPSTPN